ncbi:MAG TPA: Gfo/Idh/MocA family oxidoreductase [Rickettsiales bacterium]|nr:Gfo/Idh/MocA family oxidoreductase [Rickettsiales bacterium]
MSQKLKACIIGLGRQNLKDNLPSIKLNDNLIISSICDKNVNILKDISDELNVASYEDFNDVIKYDKPDCVFIALPHNLHFNITKSCLENNIHVFKEKPVAINYNDAIELEKINKKYNNIFYTTSQRRFSKLFNLAKQNLRKIGDIYSVDMNYTMHLENLENSWRSNKNLAGGGVLIDMGYHYIDILLWFFGFPGKIYSSISDRNLINQFYNTEDTIKIIFEYKNNNVKNSIVSLNLSRTYPQKQESIVFLGTNGYMVLTKDILEIYNKKSELIKQYQKDENENVYSKQINYFVDLIIKKERRKNYLGSITEHINHIKLIDYIYQNSN